MNWGKGLIIAFVIFALMMAGFMVSMMRSGGESVPNKYYEKGNRYQEVIDEKAGAGKFGPRLEYSVDKKAFVLAFDSMQPDSGMIVFNWPPDMRRSFSAKWEKHEGQELMLFEKASRPEGFWNADVTMYKDAKRYRWQTRLWAK